MEGPISGYVKLMDSVRPGIIFSAKASSEEFGLCWSYREHRDIHGCVPIKCEMNLAQGPNLVQCLLMSDDLEDLPCQG